MRIVEIIPSLIPVNGAERLVYNLSKAFAMLGHEVIIISLYSNKDEIITAELETVSNINLYFLSKKPGVDIGCAKRLKKLIDEINPDVIHCHLDSLITIWISRVFKKYSTYYTFHTLISEDVLGSKNKPKNMVYKHILKKGMVYPISISRVIKESVCNYFLLDEKSVRTVYNGVPIIQFKNSNTYANREYDFIFIGRFIKIKNPLLIVRAFLNVKKTYPNSKMVMIGEGPLLEKCKEEANGQICFTGFINDVSKYLSNSKCLVLLSDYEGNPMVINEAIASKCYVISTSVGGVPDVVNQSNGSLIDAESNFEKELENKMKEFIINSEMAETIINKNYEQNKQLVSIDRTASDYLKIFERIYK